MSTKGYFEHVLKQWYNMKHTPAVKSDMKVVFSQLDTAIAYEELTEEEARELKSKFNEIYHEVYD